MIAMPIRRSGPFGKTLLRFAPLLFDHGSDHRNPAPRGLHGTFARNSSSHTVASESLGARQSPRGLSDPPEPTFGPFGRQLRLNWLI
jgi:hypothetical protein